MRHQSRQGGVTEENHTQQQMVSKLHGKRNVSADLAQRITKNWRVQTCDKQTVTSPTETIHVAQMMLRSAAVCFGLSHCCTVTAGCQHEFRNGDSHSRFPRSRHILLVTQTSTPSTRFHKSFVGITSLLQRSVCDVTFFKSLSQQVTWEWLH
jgi:cysteine synthase